MTEPTEARPAGPERVSDDVAPSPLVSIAAFIVVDRHGTPLHSEDYGYLIGSEDECKLCMGAVIGERAVPCIVSFERPVPPPPEIRKVPVRRLGRQRRRSAGDATWRNIKDTVK